MYCPFLSFKMNNCVCNASLGYAQRMGCWTCAASWTLLWIYTYANMRAQKHSNDLKNVWVWVLLWFCMGSCVQPQGQDTLPLILLLCINQSQWSSLPTLQSTHCSPLTCLWWHTLHSGLMIPHSHTHTIKLHAGISGCIRMAHSVNMQDCLQPFLALTYYNGYIKLHDFNSTSYFWLYLILTSSHMANYMQSHLTSKVFVFLLRCFVALLGTFPLTTNTTGLIVIPLFSYLANTLVWLNLCKTCW